MYGIQNIIKMLLLRKEHRAYTVQQIWCRLVSVTVFPVKQSMVSIHGPTQLQSTTTPTNMSTQLMYTAYKRYTFTWIARNTFGRNTASACKLGTIIRAETVMVLQKKQSHIIENEENSKVKGKVKVHPWAQCP